MYYSVTKNCFEKYWKNVCNNIAGILIITASVLFIGCDRKEDQVKKEDQIKTVVTFGMEQNDQDGYKNIPWGLNIGEFDKNASSTSPALHGMFFKSDSYHESKMIAKLFGVPETGRKIGGLDLSDIEWNLVPSKFQSINKDDVQWVFFDGKFVMIISEFKTSSYDAVRGDLASKYNLINNYKFSWIMQQLEQTPDTMEVNAEEFKRGATNTRIFLIKQINHMGIGRKVTGSFLMYIPNVYYEGIRNEIGQNMAKAKAAAQSKEAAQQQPDRQKVQ